MTGGLRVLLADDLLVARCWWWVLENLPVLEQQFLQQNAKVLGSLLQQQVDNATAAWQVDKALKEFSSVYPQVAVEIQMLCKLATEAHLPPIWKVLINVKKKEAVVAVSQLVEERAQQADLFWVSPVEWIYSFKASTLDVDDITASFLLFLLSTGFPEANTQAREQAIVYGMMHGGQVAPSLYQLRDIMATTAPQMARTMVALEQNYQGYSTLLDILIVVNHRVSLHFCAFVEAFQFLKMEVEEQFGNEIHMALPLFQCHTQLTMACYFNKATVHGANEGLPKFVDLIDTIKY